MAALSPLARGLLALMVVGSIPASPVPVGRCPTGRAPKGSDVGENGSGGQAPLFRLQVEGGTLGFAPSQTLTVSLAARLEFSDASVRLSTSGACGAGALHYRHEDFSPAPGCRHFLSTSRKQAMTSLPPLQWTAPQCGCVTFSVTVRRHGVFYQDRDGVRHGALSTTVCQDTRESRLELLCQAARRFSGAHVMARPDFQGRHGLQPASLSPLSLQRLELALEQRRADIQECCHLTGALKDECFADVRRRRIDRFCGDGYPGIPFTRSRSEFMVKREADCCWRLGLARYSCFASEAQVGGEAGRDQLDFSLDESDPANDLGDYPTELGVLQQETRPDRLSEAHSITPAPLARDDVISAAKPAVRPATTASTRTTTTTTMMPTTTRPLDSMEVDEAGRGQGERPRVSRDEGNPSWQRTFDLRAARKLSPLPKKDGDPVETASEGSSSVEETMNGWRRKFYRIQLKLRCCEEGRKSGEHFRGRGEEVTWSRCPREAKVAHAMTSGSRNRRMCRKNFLRCCVEEARTPSTAPGSDAPPSGGQQTSREEVTPEFAPLVRRPSPRSESSKAKPQYDVKDDDNIQDVYDNVDDDTDLVDDETDSMTSEMPAQDDVNGDRMTSVEVKERSRGGQRGRERGLETKTSGRAGQVSVLVHPLDSDFPDTAAHSAVTAEVDNADSDDSDEDDSFAEEDEEFLSESDDTDDGFSNSNPVSASDDYGDDDDDGRDDRANEEDGEDDAVDNQRDDSEGRLDQSRSRLRQSRERKGKMQDSDNDGDSDNDNTPGRLRTEHAIQSKEATSGDSSTDNTGQRSSRRHGRRQQNRGRRHNKRRRHRRKKVSP